MMSYLTDIFLFHNNLTTLVTLTIHHRVKSCDVIVRRYHVVGKIIPEILGFWKMVWIFCPEMALARFQEIGFFVQNFRILFPNEDFRCHVWKRIKKQKKNRIKKRICHVNEKTTKLVFLDPDKKQNWLRDDVIFNRLFGIKQLPSRKFKISIVLTYISEWFKLKTGKNSAAISCI